jgi:hypothetical protein
MRMLEQPYKASWVDRLTASINRLSVPAWLVYLAVSVLLVAVYVAVQAWQGAYREEGFFVWHIFTAVQPLYGLMVIHYLDRVAANAHSRFRATIKGGEDESNDALFRLTTLPARQTVLAGLLGVLLIVSQLLSYDVETLAAFLSVAPTSISMAVHNTYLVVAWVGYATGIYHAFHQLRIIGWLYTSNAVVDPSHPQPLHALSGIASRTALVILPPLYGWYLLATSGAASLPFEAPFILIMGFSVGGGLLVFIWPLWGAHQLLVDAKNQALKTNAANYRAAAEELHRTVTARELDEIDVWNKAIAALDTERRYLDRLATWPWSQGTFRNLLLALIIPILVWIVQFGLQKVFE